MSDDAPTLTPADRVIYRVFIYSPYSGFETELAIAYTAERCGVSRARVKQAIRAANPDLPKDAFQ